MGDRMLIVDDSRLNREMLKTLFSESYEILEAENGEETLQILRKYGRSIDIMLLDLMLPDISGFDIMKKRDEINFFSEIPIIVITGSEFMEDQVKALELGASDFIAKPFVPEIVQLRVNNVVASNRHMCSVKQEAQRMKKKSELDEMTGLLNKTTTEAVMNNVLRKSKSKLMALVVVDIDHFKSVNDTLGHQAGDGVIKQIAEVLTKLFRKTDVIGRIGGDEFCVLMTDLPDKKIIYEKMDKLMRIMKNKEDMDIPDYISVSIGIATNEKRNATYEGMFKQADGALYQAKEDGRGKYVEYGAECECVENSECPRVILLSGNRSVRGVIHTMIPAYIRVLEVSNIEELQQLSNTDKEYARILYADISREKDDIAYLVKLQNLNWISMENIFALCEEGNVEQYLRALQSGVADMFTVPIDYEALKRRTLRKMKRLGLV